MWTAPVIALRQTRRNQKARSKLCSDKYSWLFSHCLSYFFFFHILFIFKSIFSFNFGAVIFLSHLLFYSFEYFTVPFSPFIIFIIFSVFLSPIFLFQFITNSRSLPISPHNHFSLVLSYSFSFSPFSIIPFLFLLSIFLALLLLILL